MNDNKHNEQHAELLQLMRELQTEVRTLRTRVESLETARPKCMIDEETVAILSSTIAAFLGVKPRIRQIRLVSTESWAHQGRTTIQASHALKR